MKMLARAHVWWPRLEHELEDLVKGCPITLVINHMYTYTKRCTPASLGMANMFVARYSCGCRWYNFEQEVSHSGGCS